MDRRTLLALGFDAGRGPSTSLIGDFSGLPTQQREGQVYSAGGLSHALNSPYTQAGGIARRPADWANDYSNPGEADPLLTAQLRMGDRGGMARGASAFLGTGFNPWTQEMGGPEGEWSAPQGQGNQLDALFDTAQMLGLDTSKYSREAGGMDIRGNRTGNMDAMQLWDDLNQATKDYVSIDHMTDDGKSMVKQLYLERDGQLIPVSDPQARSGRQDSAFFDDEFKGALSTVGLAALGGYLAAPAAAGGAAGGSAAGGAAGGAAGAGQVGANALSSAWSQLPQWGQRALTGALQGGLSSGLQGGNILQGALTGGISGGAGSAISDFSRGLGLPDWAAGGVSGALRGGLGSALNGGNILQGALSGGVSGGLQGAGLPSGLANIGGRLLSGAIGGSEGGGAPAGSAAAGSDPVASVAALGSALPSGSSTPVEQLFNPNDARQRYLVNALRLNRSGRAGDQAQDRATALQKALEELTG